MSEDKKQYYKEWEQEHREERNKYHREKYREKCKQRLECEIENGIEPKQRKQRVTLKQQIAELQKQLEEKEKDNQFLKKIYLSERIKNDNYHTKKYGLDKPVEELRKIKLNPKEKEIYYKGFDNCERQFSTHIAELQQQLKSQPAEIVEEIKQTVKNNLVYPDNRIDCPFNDGYLDEETLCSIMDKVLQEYQKGEN